MEREIIIDTEQLESLLALIDKHGTIGDFYTARDIFKAESTALLRKGDNKEWAQSLALGAVLRIGYIMGQRAERRRHTHTPRLSSLGLVARKSERGLLCNG